MGDLWWDVVCSLRRVQQLQGKDDTGCHHASKEQQEGRQDVAATWKSRMEVFLNQLNTT